jgi:hypothetical protein
MKPIERACDGAEGRAKDHDRTSGTYALDERSPDPQPLPARTWIDDPAGAAGASIAGTLADPWSFDYAATGADRRIRPGTA